MLKARLWLACLLSVAVPASVHPYFCVPVPVYVAAAEAVWVRVCFCVPVPAPDRLCRFLSRVTRYMFYILVIFYIMVSLSVTRYIFFMGIRTLRLSVTRG